MVKLVGTIVLLAVTAIGWFLIGLWMDSALRVRHDCLKNGGTPVIHDRGMGCAKLEVIEQ